MTIPRQPMSGIDTAWLHMDRATNLLIINTLMTFPEPLDIAKVRDIMEERLLYYDRFRQRITHSWVPLTPPVWEPDPHFDINSHIHHIALPEPGTQAQLEMVISDLISQSLDMTKPLWQLYVIDNYLGGSATLTRIHHCVADGIALTRVLLSLTDDSADAKWMPPDSAEIETERTTFDKLFGPTLALTQSALHTTGAVWQGGKQMLRHPTEAAATVKLGIRGAARLARLVLYPADPPSLFKGDLGTRKWATWSRPLPLEEVKEIGHHYDATINDVLLTAMSGALRRYLVSQEQPVSDMVIRAYVPVNLRPLDGPLRLGNYFGLVFLSLPVGIVEPRQRLAALKKCMDEIKTSPEAIVSLSVLFAMGFVPNVIETLGINFFGMKTSAVMTNVPGPRKTIYFAGVPVRTIMPWVPQTADIGLGVSIFSYNGSVRLGVITDVNRVPDPHQIIDGFHDEFDMLLALVEEEGQIAPDQCQALTKAGTRCKLKAQPGTEFCHVHQQELVAA
ncbi:MAG: wax ester/triacylglycerol synthase family O-acyltransferase [Anaerolineae bacterium]|nr:wax ester/triacylglycerol synthase family O-acyltransferase [Anaerolineae bacterium]